MGISQLGKKEIEALASALDLPSSLRKGTASQTFFACVEHAKRSREVLREARALDDDTLHAPITHGEKLYPLCDAIQRWRSEGGDVVATTGPGGVRVRSMTAGERERMRECLAWIQGLELDDHGLAERTKQRLDEARERWPDVAALIGF